MLELFDGFTLSVEVEDTVHLLDVWPLAVEFILAVIFVGLFHLFSALVLGGSCILIVSVNFGVIQGSL